MTKHTPGPWVKVNRLDAQDKPCGINIVRDGGALLTICRLPDGATIPGGHAWKYQMANAKLIAAAPDLLDACQLVERAYVGDGVDMSVAVDACLLAIKKATE